MERDVPGGGDRIWPSCRDGEFIIRTTRAARSPASPISRWCGAGRLIFAELKSEDGVTTDEQTAWLIDLIGVTDVIRQTAPIGSSILQVYKWRPSDWPEIEQALKR